jgi:uncharacterized membrane protein YgcG
MRILFETVCVAIAAGLLALLVISPPSWPVALVAAWAVLCLLFAAGWSLLRHRTNTARAKAEYDMASRELHRRASRDRMAKTRPPVKLTSHALTRLNVQRRATGRPPLSPAGYYRALQTAPDTTRSQNDWLLWFLLWDANSHSNAHQYCQRNDNISNSLEIQPGGGQFGGAGASGMWTEEPRGLTARAEEHRDVYATAAALAMPDREAVQRFEDQAPKREEWTPERDDRFSAPSIGVPGDWGDNGNRAPSIADPLPERSPSYESTKTPSESESTYSAPSTSSNDSGSSSSSYDSGSSSSSSSDGGGGGGGGD